MENVGCSALAERMIKPKDQVTDDSTNFFNRVTVHELAHSWFGDYVSIEWWDSVWLKESFADYCAGTCAAECEYLVNNYPDPEAVFVSIAKEAYYIDNSSVTHPIKLEVEETTSAVNAFDHICYRRGASFVKVLANFVGREVMAEAIKQYMETYKLGCAKLLAFIDTLDVVLKQKGSDKDVKKFAESWLLTSGCNSLQASIEEVDGKFNIHVK